MLKSPCTFWKPCPARVSEWTVYLQNPTCIEYIILYSRETHILNYFRNSVLSILLIFLLPFLSNGQATSSVSGNWSSPLIWSPAAPTAGQTVTIPAGVTVYVDVTTVMISDLIVNGTLIINSDATSDLNIAGNITINGNSILENNGGIHINTPASSFTILGTGVYIHNPSSNVLSDESIFYNCNESFSTTSTLK